MTGNDISADINGGPVGHVPVMLNEVLMSLSPAAGQLHVDGTFGAGGYTRAILESGASVVAIDRDPDAIANGQVMVAEFNGRLNLAHGRFSQMEEVVHNLGLKTISGVVLDIGVSSMQLDQAERGFSFRNDGPLDMRMSQSGVSAADVVNNAAQADLTRIIGILGEEKKASLVSRAIVRERGIQPFETTRRLASVIEKAVGRKHSDRIHPATRSFQALRILVNRELEELAEALFAAERLLREGGRLVVVTFHSLEDRIVKRFFADRSGAHSGSRHMPEMEARSATFSQKGKSILKAAAEEAEINPRARSAKLRFGVRTEAGAGSVDMSIFGLPNLADLKSFAHGETRA